MSWFETLDEATLCNPFEFYTEPALVSDLREEDRKARQEFEQLWWDGWYEQNGDDADDTGVNPPPFESHRMLPTDSIFVKGELTPAWVKFLEGLTTDEEHGARARLLLLAWRTASRADRYLPKAAAEVKASLYALAEKLAEWDDEGLPPQAKRVYCLAALVSRGAGLDVATGKWEEMAAEAGA